MESPPIDWSKIDTVLLDMDGTLLDLRFDNWFWRELVPARYAALHDLTTAAASMRLEPKFRAMRGTMHWYCIDYWSQELGLDIAQIKRSALEHVRYLPGAENFLAKLKASGKRRILVTNAHPTTLAIKAQRVGLAAHFDALYSTHAFHAPKEHASFWPRLRAAEPFAPERTLFVDDNLAVLDAALEFGIGWLRAVRIPDSAEPPQDTGRFAAVGGVDELFT